MDISKTTSEIDDAVARNVPTDPMDAARKDELQCMREHVADLSARVDELENDREYLALAIMGGEDAPGFAMAQTTETLVELVDKNKESVRLFARHEGRLQGLNEAAKVAETKYEAPPKGIHGFQGDMHVAGLEIAKAIQSLKEQGQ